MGRRGPLKYPPNVSALRGIPRKPTKNIDPVPDIPKPPADLRGLALKVWKKTAPELFRLGRLALIDAPTLAFYCRWCAHVDGLEKKLAETAYLVKGQKGMRSQIRYGVSTRQRRAMVVKLAKELGCTPDARLRASNIPIEEDELDELEAILTRPIR
jgi:P27 family predicted phage terminase small subunit